MAQKSVFTVAAWKIQNPQGSTTFDGGSTTAGTTQTTIVSLGSGGAIFLAVPARTGSTSTNDTLLQTGDGWKIYFTQELADTATALSATDMTTS